MPRRIEGDAVLIDRLKSNGERELAELGKRVQLGEREQETLKQARTAAEQEVAALTRELEALKAQALLAERFGVAAEVYSAPSFQLLRNEALEVEQLLGQKIEGGLGLTAELASKYDGSLDVEREEHESWAKAVVIKLPREEVADAE